MRPEEDDPLEGSSGLLNITEEDQEEEDLRRMVRVDVYWAGAAERSNIEEQEEEKEGREESEKKEELAKEGQKESEEKEELEKEGQKESEKEGREPAPAPGEKIEAEEQAADIEYRALLEEEEREEKVQQALIEQWEMLRQRRLDEAQRRGMGEPCHVTEEGVAVLPPSSPEEEEPYDEEWEVDDDLVPIAPEPPRRGVKGKGCNEPWCQVP